MSNYGRLYWVANLIGIVIFIYLYAQRPRMDWETDVSNKIFWAAIKQTVAFSIAFVFFGNYGKLVSIPNWIFLGLLGVLLSIFFFLPTQIGEILQIGNTFEHIAKLILFMTVIDIIGFFILSFITCAVLGGSHLIIFGISKFYE